jgi:hypothetical protein
MRRSEFSFCNGCYEITLMYIVTLTNEINENLSLLSDDCSLLTLVNNENYY